MTEVEFETLRQLYETIKDTDSASYSVFVKKLRRLATDNTRTFNRLSRDFGIVQPRKRSPRRPKAKVDPIFIAYDGEGWDDKLVLLANSLGEHVVNRDGLSTKDCLELLAVSYKIPVKRVFFSFGYDVNHIIKDLTDLQIGQLLIGDEVEYEGYRIAYIPGKMFIVNNYYYYDVFSFFQTNFINVVKRMLGPEFVSESLVAGKAARGTFDTWDQDKLMAYNSEELDLLVQILNRLRDAFREVNTDLQEWYGPGAVAKYWFKQHEVYPNEKHHYWDILALNSAYYGGRFEQLKLGSFKNVYEYDIHSAYPAAMADMPHFLSWSPSKTFSDNPYSIWYITFDLRESQKDDDPDKWTAFLPLPVRGSDGRICFPLVGKGWYWQSEVKVMLDFFPDAKVIWHKGYIAKTEGKPFEWIKDLYVYRQELKESGNLAQYAVKVGLNSLYGKTAQRIGSNPFFSLSWAGYITSTTRAKLARAGYECGSQNVIGFATDAIFTTTPLNVPTTDSLGDWESSKFNKAVFIQSGVYRLINADGTVEDRYRGSPLRNGIDSILTQLKESPKELPKVHVGRFVSHMLGIKAPKAYGSLRLQFIKVEHTLQLDAPYKRHYTGFMTKIDDKGKIISDYSRLLTMPIESYPKVWVGDVSMFERDEYIWGNRRIQNYESLPPPVTDRTTQLLLEDASRIALLDGDLTDISLLEGLPLVEDESM